MSAATAMGRPQAVFVLETRAQVEDALAIRPHLPGPVGYLAFSPRAANVLVGAGTAHAGDQVWITPWLQTWSPRLAKLVSVLNGRSVIRGLARAGSLPVFVFGNDMNSVDRALIEFASGLGAKTLLVQDGVVNDRDFADFSEQDRQARSVASRLALLLGRASGLVPAFAVYGTGRCDRIAAFGPSTREILAGWGVPASRIVITGSPRLDSLFRVDRESQSVTEIRRVLYLGVVLGIAGVAPDAADDAWTDALEFLVRERPGWDVVVRPHPQDPIDRYARIRTRCPALRVDAGSPFHDLLKASDVVVVHFPSTGVLEALALGRPVVFHDLGFPCADNLYTKEEGLVTMARPDCLVATLERAVREQALPARVAARDAALFRHLGPLDGRSAERVAAVIESLRERRPGEEAFRGPRPS